MQKKKVAYDDHDSFYGDEPCLLNGKKPHPPPPVAFAGPLLLPAVCAQRNSAAVPVAPLYLPPHVLTTPSFETFPTCWRQHSVGGERSKLRVEVTYVPCETYGQQESCVGERKKDFAEI